METNDNLPKKADGKSTKPANENLEDNTHEDAMIQESESTKDQEHIEVEKESEEKTKKGNNTTKSQENDDDDAHEDAIIEEKKKVESTVDPIVDVDEDEDDDEESDDDEDDDIDGDDDNKRKSPDQKDYNEMSIAVLTKELRNLMQEYPINKIKEPVREIEKAFEQKDKDLQAEQKEAFDKGQKELPEEERTADFNYDNKESREFKDLHALYRKQRGEFQRQVRKEKEQNLEKRRSIIEGIKNLIDEEENIGTTFKKFNQLQDDWKNTGSIPHDAYNIVWEDYRLHVQNFYDYISLSKELRDKDFERNLEFHNKIIARAKELADEPNVHKALRELQELHRMWKEDTGPVAKEMRDPIWEEFKAASDVIHDRRQAYYAERDKQAATNQTIKENIIAEIEMIVNRGGDSHKAWQDSLQEVNALRELFTTTGGAPKKVNNELWNQFRGVTREFNKVKNDYYKGLKKEQQDNLDKKMELVKIAEEHAEAGNFQESLDTMKRIQAQWKTIGHVPRKDSDKIWKRFQKACNSFFDQKNAKRNAESKEEVANYEAKLKVYDKIKDLLPQDDQEAMKSQVEALMEEWSAIGRVPHSKRQIQDKFEKLVKAKFIAAGMTAVDAEMLKYNNKLDSLKEGDERDFKNERFYLRKRRDEIQDEMRQLENNLQFINAKDDKNPFLVQQRKNIAALQKELDIIKEKQKQLNILQRQLERENEPEESDEENATDTAE
ncbi:protein of unknown function [Nonlabens sp. Hel1_33_55]|uniref:DUF349 domain-containing protein n=1 Tax=Nonlabens sp. Hel1_33_55 TaxID=1336802 RepID=UPI000875F009|nr:DUF349 domain-containing protein [Nonlabens sp. Hel1_33_55]SCY07813.1 protein of unknown function [Nonlabens sp. Hel1_33_55]